jgi:hypothetical protein
MALGGRPKEENGHERIDLTLNKKTREKLDKIKKKKGNVSKFIEKELKPTLDKLDPGELSIHIYRIQVYLANEISDALQQGKLEDLKVLAGIANAIDDYRALAGILPLDYKVKALSQNMHSPISPKMALTILRYRFLAKAYGVKLADDIADILEDLPRKNKPRD